MVKVAQGTVTKLCEGVYRVQEGGMNLYLIVDGGEMALVDAGCADAPGERIFDYIKSIGMGEGCLKYVLVTHAHHDHMGMSYMLQTRTPAKVAIHILEASWFEDHDALFSECYYRYTPPPPGAEEGFRKAVGHPCRADVLLRDGDILEVGVFKIETVHMPGHTLGNMSLYNPKYKMLFTGDSLENSLDFTANNRLGIIYDAAKYESSLLKLTKREVEWVLPGHFNVHQGYEARDDVQSCLRAVKRVEGIIMDILGRSGEGLTLRQVRERLVKESGLTHYREELELQTTNAYLHKLLAEGKVDKNETWRIP